MTSRRDAVLTAGLLIAAARQACVLRGIARSGRFLRDSHVPKTPPSAVQQPLIFVVLPVLREVTVLPEAVDHFTKMTADLHAEIVVVTTERERAEHPLRQAMPDTVDVASRLAAAGRCRHVHYPDPEGVKADQLNYAATLLAGTLDADQTADTFLICYDADSRPPLDSLITFMAVLSDNPDADVLHQSSRFEVRQRSHSLLRPIADAGALRANRFVLGYELPRLLNRSPAARPWKRLLSSFVYTHVTGHGLCLRLSQILDVPFPPGSPLEDMHYSFILGSRNVAMHPIPSLDVADVPASLTVQVEQAARWFYGPGRFRRYRRDPATASGGRARMLEMSAAAICLEWLSCAGGPAAMAFLAFRGPRSVRLSVATFTGIYTVQLAISDVVAAPNSPAWGRLCRLIWYPANCTLFGLGGIIGATRLVRGASGWGKTERLPR